ncbi:MAG TPA: cytochrome c1 [Steroidobacteraceae bacterium]|nr:cytochrome c1 [Steroidobacteraceae bacterium]
MVKRTAIVLMLAACAAAFGEDNPNQKCVESLGEAQADVTNVASLQKGSRNFVNYCLGCHSLGFMRWNRVAKDLRLSDEQLRQNLIFTGAKVHDYIKSPMPRSDATEWFGRAPPDLTLITRAKGPDYVYRFLKGFYRDDSPSRPTGVNNLIYDGASMPAVLADLQGVQRLESHAELGAEGKTRGKLCDKIVLDRPGRMSAAEFDVFVHDTVNFLTYIGEPGRGQRQSMGVVVILFLLVFTAFAYLLKKEYWKDVH